MQKQSFAFGPRSKGASELIADSLDLHPFCLFLRISSFAKLRMLANSEENGEQTIGAFTEASPSQRTDVRVLPHESADQPTNWQKLKKYSGAVRGPPKDMARNHDHYIHGGPRK
jgi:hypothetical protein